jgi:hypothetical protein
VETKTNKIMERELRIGNLVLTTDVLIPYHRIEPEDLVSMKDGSFKKLGIEIKPIPLTEDILLKCEGVKHDFNDWYIIEFKDYEMCVNIIDKSLTIGDDYSERLISSNLEYVHQFQNIIFALTNEELEINL